MKFRNTVTSSIVICCILVLSLGIGYVFDAVCRRADYNKHPRLYAEYVTEYAALYGVPEYIAYAVIKTESDFQSNYVSADGNVGLMQLSETTFRQLATMMKENTDSGILYDPETNVRYGIYYLSYLYTEYNRWNTVFAVFFAGRETVDAWMADPSLTDTLGNLTKIPDDATADFVKSVTENVELYKELYYIDNHA